MGKRSIRTKRKMKKARRERKRQEAEYHENLQKQGVVCTPAFSKKAMNHPKVKEVAKVRKAENENLTSAEAALKMAAALEGTCHTMASMFYSLGIPEALEDNVDFTSRLDEEVFNCQTCGWWCSTDELHNEGDGDICEDCHREEHGEDDE